MGRLVLAVLLAPVFWGVLQIPGNLLLTTAYPHAMATQPTPLGFLLLALLASFIYGIFAGYCSAWCAGDKARQAGLWAGIVLLIVGIAVQAVSWSLLPVWWHLTFLVAIMPMAFFGARLRIRQNSQGRS